MNISIKNLTKTYKQKTVLSIDQAEFRQGLTAITGTNGCGKTTLLNILAGQLTYNSGDILYLDQSYSKSLAKDISLVEQKPLLFNRSVYDNIAYPLKLRAYKHQDIKDRVNHYLHAFKLESIGKQNAHNLSGGEMQKVAIARAMIFSPKLLMLDEPTNNIDKDSTGVIEKAMRDYADKGNTVLLVTHDFDRALRLSDTHFKMTQP